MFGSQVLYVANKTIFFIFSSLPKSLTTGDSTFVNLQSYTETTGGGRIGARKPEVPALAIQKKFL